MEVYYQYWQTTWDFLYANREILDVLVGFFLAAAILVSARIVEKRRKAKIRKETGARVTKKKHLKALHTQAGKAFSDWLVDQELNGVFSASDVRYLSRRASYAFEMKDILGDKISFSGLTTEERELLNSVMRSKEELRKMIETRFKPKIPGAKPGEVDNVHVYSKQKKKFGDQLRKKIA